MTDNENQQVPANHSDQVPEYIQEKLKRDFDTPEELIVVKDPPKLEEPNGPAKKRGPLNRVTVVEHVHHQVEGDDTNFVTAKYYRILKTDMAAYKEPNAKIGKDWEPIYTGRIKPADVGVFVILNTTGNNRQVILSQEEQAAIDAAVIQIGKRVVIPDKGVDVITDIVDIPPNRHAHIDPSSSADLYFIRCLKGTAKFTIFVVPS